MGSATTKHSRDGAGRDASQIGSNESETAALRAVFDAANAQCPMEGFFDPNVWTIEQWLHSCDVEKAVADALLGSESESRCPQSELASARAMANSGSEQLLELLLTEGGVASKLAKIMWMKLQAFREESTLGFVDPGKAAPGDDCVNPARYRGLDTFSRNTVVDLENEAISAETREAPTGGRVTKKEYVDIHGGEAGWDELPNVAPKGTIVRGRAALAASAGEIVADLILPAFSKDKPEVQTAFLTALGRDGNVGLVSKMLASQNVLERLSQAIWGRTRGMAARSRADTDEGDGAAYVPTFQASHLPNDEVSIGSRAVSFQSKCMGSPVPAGPSKVVDMVTPMSIVIFGATGDLARKKLFPALYQLVFGCPGAPLLPAHVNIVGFGRKPEIDVEDFFQTQCVNIKGDRKSEFLSRCMYFGGGYTDDVMGGLHEFLCGLEGGGTANRIFFFSIPPNFFGDAVRAVKQNACAPGGFTRLIIEKPFGHDSESFAKLDRITSVFDESSLYRIDHYLGKEVVLNLVTLRFGNQLFEPIWNKENIASVQIVFKEDLGTAGRGAYFDKSGIIRDIMQNHLLQVMLWLTMEPPASLTRESVAQAKNDLLASVETLTTNDCFVGQFGRNSWMVNGKRIEAEGYTDDPGVPTDSRTPTYAAVVLHIDNDRWRGVPFMMRAGKGLDERMAEVRITFKKAIYNDLVPGERNELVMRIQPDEAIYLKTQNKIPGWEQDKATQAVLDMTYSNAFPGCYVADAYERMFLNTAKGDGSLFVGSEELREAWRIFTPLLKELEEKKVQPEIYPFGVHLPKGMVAFAERYNIRFEETWQEYLSLHAARMDLFEAAFAQVAVDGVVGPSELKRFARKFYDGREPTDEQVARIFSRLDLDGSGSLTEPEIRKALVSLANNCVACNKQDMSQWDSTKPANSS